MNADIHVRVTCYGLATSDLAWFLRNKIDRR